MFLDGSLLLLGRSEGPALPVTVRVTSLRITTRGGQALELSRGLREINFTMPMLKAKRAFKQSR